MNFRHRCRILGLISQLARPLLGGQSQLENIADSVQFRLRRLLGLISQLAPPLLDGQSQ